MFAKTYVSAFTEENITEQGLQVAFIRHTPTRAGPISTSLKHHIEIPY